MTDLTGASATHNDTTITVKVHYANPPGGPNLYVEEVSPRFPKGGRGYFITVARWEAWEAGTLPEPDPQFDPKPIFDLYR